MIDKTLAHTIPFVLEQDGRGERSYDIFSRLLKDRIVIVGEIDAYRADIIVAQLLWLTNDDPNKDIQMYINSPGGEVTAGLAIYDTMQYIPNDVVTIVMGQAASMGAVLCTAGTKGKRFALPHSRIMIHQPLGGTRGQQSDIERQAKEISRLRQDLELILSDHSGKPLDQIHLDCDRDYFMSAKEAVEYGLIDKVVKQGELVAEDDKRTGKPQR